MCKGAGRGEDMKVQWSLRIEEGLFEKIKEISVDEVRSLNNTLEWMLATAVKDYERERGCKNVEIPKVACGD